jgi:predicted membrane-bound spermidine synthase
MLPVFLLSGFAALVYQVAWQRSLYAIFGANTESVSVIVTAFMLGLGVGSLAGGALSRDASRPLLLYFSLIELAIGAFGAVSLQLFDRVGEATLASSATVAGAASFLLLLPPTLLMGSALPMLVTVCVSRSRNVGRSVGTLYFVNTLGSAIAAFATVLVLLRAMGLQRTVYLAVVVNASVAFVTFVQYRRGRRGAWDDERGDERSDARGGLPSERAP